VSLRLLNVELQPEDRSLSDNRIIEAGMIGAAMYYGAPNKKAFDALGKRFDTAMAALSDSDQRLVWDKVRSLMLILAQEANSQMVKDAHLSYPPLNAHTSHPNANEP
jgi:hypothetical protein